MENKASYLIRCAKQAAFAAKHWQGWADDIRTGRVKPRPGLVTPERAERNATMEAMAAGKYLGRAYRARGL